MPLTEEQIDDIIIEFAENGAARTALEEALKSAYPDSVDLERLMRKEFGVDLRQTAGDNLPALHFNLIQWAVAKGNILRLLAVVVEDRPDNPYIRRFLRSYSRYREGAEAVGESKAAGMTPVTAAETRSPINTVPTVGAVASLRGPLTERLSRTEVGVLWFDLFGTAMDNELPGRGKSECVIELLERVRQRRKEKELLADLSQSYPHVLVGGVASRGFDEG